jgi:hypothetical protein
MDSVALKKDIAQTISDRAFKFKINNMSAKKSSKAREVAVVINRVKM